MPPKERFIVSRYDGSRRIDGDPIDDLRTASRKATLGAKWSGSTALFLLSARKRKLLMLCDPKQHPTKRLTPHARCTLTPLGVQYLKKKKKKNGES